MWIPSISPPNLSLISPLTTEIYHRTEITANNHRQTHTKTESDTLPIYDIGSSNKSDTLPIYDIGSSNESDTLPKYDKHIGSSN